MLYEPSCQLNYVTAYRTGRSLGYNITHIMLNTSELLNSTLLKKLLTLFNGI